MSEQRFYYDPREVDYGPPLVSVTIYDRESTDHCRCFSAPFAETVTAALNAAEENKRLLHEAEKLIATAEGWWETFAYPERTTASDHCKELCDRSQQWLAEYQLTKGESDGN